MSFKGKVILITGASSGIGADAARHLAKLGGEIAMVGRNEERLSAVADEILSSGSPTPLKIIADVTKDSERIIDETIAYFGKLDVLINNAGYIAQGNVVDLKIDEFDHMMNTHLRSAIRLTNLAVPHLEKTEGNIVNVSSVAGLKALPNLMSYCIAKIALNQFTKCCALDLASRKIRVNAINPSAVRTHLLEGLGIKPDDCDMFYEEHGKHYPVGRVGTVEDTSAAIAFLASDSASFLTGIYKQKFGTRKKKQLIDFLLFSGILLPIDGGCLTGKV